VYDRIKVLVPKEIENLVDSALGVLAVLVYKNLQHIREIQCLLLGEKIQKLLLLSRCSWHSGILLQADHHR
jgi:hypothetical protein